MFRVVCPSCGKTLQADPSSIGRTARCPNCLVEIAIPDPLGVRRYRRFVRRRAASLILVGVVIGAGVWWALGTKRRPRPEAGRIASVVTPAPPIPAPSDPILPASFEPDDINSFTATAPPEHVLAFLDSGLQLPYSDRRVARFKALLTLADQKYRDDAASIARQTISTRDAIVAQHREASLSEILQGSTQLHELGVPPPPEGWSYDEYLTWYELYRTIEDADHAGTMARLTALERVAYARAEGDQAKQAAFLVEAGIKPDDGFKIRLTKILTLIGNAQREAGTSPLPHPPPADIDGPTPFGAKTLQPAYPHPSRKEATPTPPPVHDPKAEVIYGRARLLEKDGKRSSAIAAYQQIVEGSPNSEQAIKAKARLKALKRR